MKKVININFQGRVIPIEESAYDILKQYIESLTKFFAHEEGKEEIINDIEGRIAELFGESLKKGSTCITDDDVNRIIASMGRPEDFEEDAASEQTTKTDASSTSNSSNNNSTSEPKKLFRDENHKVLGGVCAGFANYFGIDPVIMRVITIIFFGATFIPYLILWVVLPSSASTAIGSQRKRLFRDPDEKVIAGVCSGLAQYFGISVIIPRLLFIIPFLSFVFHFSHWGWWDFPHFLSFSFSPGSFIFYIILWLVIPEAKSSADKLEMKGEKVDLNNIKTTIQSDLEGFGKKAQQWGQEIGASVGSKSKQFSEEFSQTVSSKGKQFSTEASTVAKKAGRGLGDIIVLIFKIFAYFIIGVVLIAVVIALFSMGIALTSLTPLKPFIIANGWEEVLVWGTLLFFIWVPVIGIITLIIRRIAGIKRNSKLIRYSFLSLWLIGLFCFIALISSLRNDYHYTNHAAEENITISNPKINKLELTAPNTIKYYNRRWLKIEPFVKLDEDTVFVQNVKIRIVKSLSDSFTVTMVKLANGSSKREADNIASKIKYDIIQQDSLLKLDKGIGITQDQKFRNQHIILTIAVPVGKKIMVNDNIGWNDGFDVHIGFDGDNWESYYYQDQEEERWRRGVEYIQTEKGLQRTDNLRDDDNNSDNGDYNNTLEEYKKSKEQMLREKEQKLKELKEIDKQLQQNNNDSTRYHYQPKQTPTAPATKNAVRSAKINNSKPSIQFEDLLFLKFLV